jgi:hypothetical protein
MASTSGCAPQQRRCGLPVLRGVRLCAPKRPASKAWRPAAEGTRHTRGCRSRLLCEGLCSKSLRTRSPWPRSQLRHPRWPPSIHRGCPEARTGGVPPSAETQRSQQAAHSCAACAEDRILCSSVRPVKATTNMAPVDIDDAYIDMSFCIKQTQCLLTEASMVASSRVRGRWGPMGRNPHASESKAALLDGDTASLLCIQCS